MVYTEKKKIFIVDDHAIVRKGVKAIFSESPGYSVVGEAASGLDLVVKIGAAGPDVVLLDIKMPDMDGIEATRQIKERFPEIKVVIFTMHIEPQYAVEAFRAGANGFLVKGLNTDEVITAVDTVLSGRLYTSPLIMDFLLNDFVGILKSEPPPEPQEKLTSREKEILTLIAGGLTNAEIGKRLFIAESTVKSHRVHLMVKLQVKGMAGLLKAAIRMGLVNAD